MSRWYLLGALSWGLLVPLAPDFVFTQGPSTFFSETLRLSPTFVRSGSVPWFSSQVPLPWRFFVLGGYFAGVALYTYRIFKGLYKIKQLVRAGRPSPYGNLTVVRSERITQAFSFFRWVFLPQVHALSSVEEKWILKHEVEHLRRRHSIDLLFVEVLGILLWFFRPILLLYKRELVKLHEYQADAAALRVANKKAYCRMLLEQAHSNRPWRLSHTFFSNLENRFVMMLKPKSNKVSLFKYILITPIAIYLSLLVSAFPSAAQTEAIFKTPEEMPLFSGCEDVGDREERIQCSNEKLIAFISKEIKYPKKARKKGIQGMVVVSFIIEKDGTITHVKVVRDIGGGCGAEAKRVVKMMPPWIPGTQDGQPIRVQYNLPVKFKL